MVREMKDNTIPYKEMDERKFVHLFDFWTLIRWI